MRRSILPDMPDSVAYAHLRHEKEKLTAEKAKLTTELKAKAKRLEQINERLMQIEQGERVLAGR